MSGRNGIVIALALLIVGVIVAMLYRTASHDDLPEDEWLDFEHAQ